MDDKQVKNFFEKLLQQFDGPKAMGWGGLETQSVRFKVLLDILPDDIGEPSVCTLLDVGCGDAALLRYIVAHQDRLPLINYHGFDFVPEMVACAHQCCGMFSKQIIQADILHVDKNNSYMFDYVVASGLFSHRDYDYLFTAVDHMLDISRHGVAFNCLKDGYSGEHRTNGEFYADPDLVMKGCKRLADKASIEVVSDYLPNDFTVFIKEL